MPGFWDGYQESPGAVAAPARPAAPQPAAPAPAPGGLRGFLGGVYDTVAKPLVNSVGGAISDVPKIGQSVYNLGRIGVDAAKGDMKGAYKATQDQNNLLKSSSFVNNFTNTNDKNYHGGDIGGNLEKSLGKTGGQILNLTAPLTGAESMAGKTGMRLIGTGIGVGAKLGAAGGVANAAAQGGSGKDLFVGGGAGLIQGGLAGGAGGVLGATLGSKLLGGAARGAGNLGKGVAEGITGKTLGGGAAVTPTLGEAGAKLSMADKAATNKAQSAFDQQFLEHFGLAKDTEGINPIVKDMQAHGLEPTVPHMSAYSQAGNGIEGVKNYLLDKHATQAIPVDINSVIDSAIKNQPGIGRDTNTVTQALRSMLSDTLNPSGNITGKYTPQDVYSATKALYNAKSANPAVTAAFKDARSSLTNILNKEGGLSKSIADYKLPTVQEAQASGATVTDATGHGHALAVLDAAGGNESLANAQIAKINAASKFQDLQAAQIPHIRAGDIAKSASEGIDNALPKPVAGNSSTGLPGPFEAIQAAHGNPIAALSVGVKAARSGPVQNTLAKFGTADASQVGPRVASELTPNMPTAPEVGAPVPNMPEQPSPAPAPQPTPPAGSGGPQYRAAYALGNGARNVVDAAGQIPGAIRSMGTPGVGALTGALTGSTAVSAGQGDLNAPPAAPGTMGQVDTSAVDQLGSAAGASATDNPQPTLDASTIPGGTLADYEAEVQADPKNAATYKSIYDAAQAEVKNSVPTKMNATEAKNMTNIQNASITLKQYVDSLNSLSANTRGMGVGPLTALLGKTGHGGSDATTAAYLESKKPELAIQIAQAINNGTKPQGQQIKDIEEMLPSIGDPKAVASMKIQQLAESMSGYLKVAGGSSITNRGSGNTSDVLTQLQGAQ